MRSGLLSPPVSPRSLASPVSPTSVNSAGVGPEPADTARFVEPEGKKAGDRDWMVAAFAAGGQETV